MKLLPGLFNFLKSNDSYKLESFSAGIYKLKKRVIKCSGYEISYMIIHYKVKRTTYVIYSSEATTEIKGFLFRLKRGKTTFKNGYVVVKKGFGKYTFKDNELNSDLTNSINRHMDDFNKLIRSYNQQVVDKKKEKEDRFKKNKLGKFLKGLDF